MTLLRLECGGVRIEIWEVDHGPPHCHVSGLLEAWSRVISYPEQKERPSVSTQTTSELSPVAYAEFARVTEARYLRLDAVLYVRFGDGWTNPLRN